MNSAEMDAIRDAQEAGRSVSFQIGGRIVQYEPGMSASGMTMLGENGFLIGRDAFANAGELESTVLHELHELHRLTTSSSASGVYGALAADETAAAEDFAARGLEALIK